MEKNKVRIIDYFKNNALIFFFVCIFGLLFDGLMCFVPRLQGDLISSFEHQLGLSTTLRNGIIFILFILFVQINRFFKRYFVRLFANRIILSMREKSMKNILYSNKEDKNISKGDLLNRILNDIEDSTEGIRKITTEVFDSILLMLCYITSMMIMDYQITLMVIPFILISIFSSSLIKRIVVSSTKKYKEELGKSKDITLSLIENEINLRSLGVCSLYDKRYESELNVLKRKGNKALVFSTALEPIYNGIALLASFIVIYFAGQKVINNIWDIGLFSAYFTTFLLVATKASKTSKAFNSYQKAKVSWLRLKPYLEDIDDKRILLTDEKISIRFSNASFSYDPSCVVKINNFEAKSGLVIGICGRVHSGKSTLIGLLSNLYDYEGNILVNGNELRNIRLSSGIGFSNNEIFNYSIKENITLGRNGDFNKAIIDSCLKDEIDKTKDKENTILHPKTMNLSGGQQKRLMIARALYSSPSLIVLDDPFNAIDILLGQQIMKNIKSNYSSSLIFIASNQRYVLENCDKIIYLEENKTSIDEFEALKTKQPSFKQMLGGEN